MKKSKTKTKAKPAARAKTTGRKHARAAAKPAFSKGKLAPIKKMLLSMREDLIKTVRKQQIADSSQQDIGDAADQASQSIEKELLFELSDNERGTLDQIEASLRKIEKGTYGGCEACRKPISKARLQALPFARYCIDCQNSSEKSAESGPEILEQSGEFRPVGEEAGS